MTAAEETASSDPQGRVLIVEDEVALADGVARGLTAEGFEVEVVHDGVSGLERARDVLFYRRLRII